MSEVVALLEDALKDLTRLRHWLTGVPEPCEFVDAATDSVGAALRVYRAEQAMSEDEARL